MEIGYADLIDEGDGSVEDIALRFICVQNGIEVLNYATTLDELEEAVDGSRSTGG